MPQQPQENKMGVMPVGRLLVSMSVPMMISMLVQALYNVVDSYFVSQVSQDALTAVSMAFPFQNLMIAVSVGTGVGINALLSRSLGEKNFETARRTAGNGLVLAVLSSIVFSVVALAAAKPFFLAQDAPEVIAEMGAEYVSICGGLCFGIFLSVTFERLLQSTGRTVFTMVTQGVGALTNIIFDPLLIFGIGPFPELGVAGAAVATVMGQVVGAVLGMVFHFKFNKELPFDVKMLKPDGHIIGRIYAVGAPSIIMNSIGSVMTFAMNKILMALDATAVTVFGVYFKIQSFFFMPVFGLNNGMVPIVAYNYGARRRKRLLDTVKLAAVIAVAIMAVGTLVMQLGAGTILDLFKAREETSSGLLDIGIPALRIISTSFILAGFNIVITSLLQALGRGILSMVVSIVRQLVVLIPAAWLLAKSGIVDLVWLSFPISELVATLLCAVFFIRTYRRIIRPLGGAAPTGQQA